MITLRPHFLQKLESFAAPDPWSGNGRVTFSIEDYVMIAGSAGPCRFPRIASA